MPTYDYKCSACGHKFERFQSMSSPPVTKCPHCGKKKVKRLLGTGAGLIFKGSGFYITDYRDSSYKDAASKDSGTAAATSESSSTSGGDSKPASDSKPTDSPAKPAAPAKAEKKSSKAKSST
ncbi:MAG: zinc ribbon domain-containing protein [Phycisphaerales bacterium]|nr:zinc ribbon domain-containing protein [Phycisphaerales bacterium]